MAYGFFFWLDKEVSDEAKDWLARTMRFKHYKNEQIASALVEVFDRIYTYPLLRWRAFFRSVLFTTVVSVIFLFELYSLTAVGMPKNFEQWKAGYLWVLYGIFIRLIILSFNIFPDYLSLFVIRPVLIRSGTKSVIGLALGAVSGAAIVLVAQVVRILTLWTLTEEPKPGLFDALTNVVPMVWTLPALAVFVWLLLFALGILIARLLTPLSWIVGRTQWFLKEGKEHPLKAIGCVAAVVVFLGTVAARAVFSAAL
jgi:hypothetical protein